MLKSHYHWKTSFIIAAVLIVALIILSSRILLKNKIFYSPIMEEKFGEYCKDGDSGTILEQAKVSSFVLYLDNKCNSLLDLNRNKNCILLTFNDYCIDNSNLVEHSCSGNSLAVSKLRCGGGCNNNICLEPSES